MCAKPVSTTNLHPDVEITCPECKQEEQGITTNVLNIITRIVSTMTTLPDNHYVWHFSDPTLTYYSTEEEIGEELNNSENATLNNFIAWYDAHLPVLVDIRNNASKQCFTSSNFPRTGDWESSSVEPIKWGKQVKPNHEEDLKRWNDISKDKQANEEEIPPTPPTNEASSEAEDNTANDARKKYKADTRYHNKDTKATNQRVESSSVAHEGRDDEQEFTRIPIAGED